MRQSGKSWGDGIARIRQSRIERARQSKTGPMMLGWHYPTWRRAFAWAGRDEPIISFSPQHFELLLDVRRQWLESGGALSGPDENFVLDGGK